MSVLSRAAKPRREPIVVTIVGTAGSGKTSLAATFPAPIIIRTQGETAPRDIPANQRPDMMPPLESADDLWETLKALAQEEHDYKTLVIDSCTGLEQLFVADVLASDPRARGINQALGGYGAGPNAVMAQHARVRRAAEVLKERGMHVVFLAHADIARVDPPDSDGFSQYTLRLPGKSMAPYVDNVDLVGFLKQATVLRGDEGQKKAITTGERVLVTYMTPATVAKNRFGINEDLEFVQGVNPLAALVEPRRRKAEPAPAVTDDETANETENA